jgi:hypothetical protein
MTDRKARAPGYWVEFNRYAKVCPWNVCGAMGLVSGHSSEADANEACKKLNKSVKRK